MINNKYYFYVTLIISVIVQIITGIIEIGTLFLNIKKELTLIKELLILEILVQTIEAIFYFWLVLNFNKVLNITPKRYIDWGITTPTMLITLVIYLIYLKKQEKNKDTSNLSLLNLFYKNSNTIMQIIYLNWLMLIFGYLGEKKIINTITGVILGFIPFLIYFYIIYEKYAKYTNSGLKLFWYFFIFWSLYGVVATLPYYIKNTFYNILDLFSKNFFGLFLSYIIITKNL